MPEKPEAVVVVGGGIVGCFIAYRLAIEGVAVTLVERDTPGAGASGTAGGNIQPGAGSYGEFQAAIGAESLRLFRHFLPDIKEASGIDPQDQEVQYFHAALNDDEARQVRIQAEILYKSGLKAQWIEGADARKIEPRLSSDVLGGMLLRDCVQMDASRFVSALAESARASGVQMLVAEVVGLQRDDNRVTGVLLKDGTEVGCDTVVLAMGAWVGTVGSEWLRTLLPARPYSLQKLHLRPKGNALGCAVNWGGINIVSRVDGLVHAGSKHDAAGFEANPTREGREWILERVNTILPGLDVEVVDSQAACAAATPGRIPILSPVEALDGVYLASTASDGFHLSAVIANMLTELLVRGKKHHFLARMRLG